MSAAADQRAALRLVKDTGELHEDAPQSYAEAIDLCATQAAQVERLLADRENLEEELRVKRAQVQKARKELAQAQGVEPGAEQVIEVLHYWRRVSGHMQALVTPGSKRWVHTRARLREGYTVERLKAAALGASLDPWCQGKPGRDDPELVFSSQGWVDKLERVAASRKGGDVVRVAPADLTPLEVASGALAREFGFHAVEPLQDAGGAVSAVLAACPLHPEPVAVHGLQLRELDGLHGGALEAVCVEGCRSDDVLCALRGLYGLQAGREPGGEIAGLRVQVADLEYALRLVWHSGQTMSPAALKCLAAEALGVEGSP